MHTTVSSFLWQHLKHKKLYLLTFFILCLFAAAEFGITAYLLKIIIDTVTTSPKETFIANVWVPVVLYVGMELYHNLTMRAYLFGCMRLYPQLKKDIMLDLFEYTSKHTISFFQNNMAGDLASKIHDVTYTAEPMLRKIFEVFIGRAINPIVGSLFLLMVSWKFSVLFLVWTVLYLYVSILLARPMEANARVYARNNNILNGKLIDVLSNIVTAKIFQRTAYEERQLSETLTEVVESEKQVHWSTLQLDFVLGILNLLLMAAFFVMLIHGHVYGNLTAGDFAFVVTLVVPSFAYINFLAKSIGEYFKDLGQYRQAVQILFLPHEIVDKPGAMPIKISRGEIECDSINFCYTANRPIFSDFSVKIAPGETVGIVGQSGAGKSSFIHLLLRLFDLQSGSIKIDGQDISQVTVDSLREQITLVPQQIDLFNRSIMDNIRYGNLNASDEQVIEAAKLAECDVFIQQLPEGYETVVGEHGVRLSGGQKQRLALARAYVKNSKILVLDEITSALDAITENYIQRALTKIMQGKTTLIIAHRLATLRQVKRILVFHEGQIVEDGSIDKLWQMNGYFKKLWDSQQDGFIR